MISKKDFTYGPQQLKRSESTAVDFVCVARDFNRWVNFRMNRRVIGPDILYVGNHPRNK